MTRQCGVENSNTFLLASRLIPFSVTVSLCISGFVSNEDFKVALKNEFK
jgi:hypothetical protein